MSDRLPLTRAQQEIRLASALSDDNGRGYRIAQYCEISGEFDLTVFGRALTECLQATDVLRVRAVRGRPLQVVGPVAEPFTFLDLSSESDPLSSARSVIDSDLQRPVDLFRDQLFSFIVFRLGPTRYWWYQSYHHFVVDVFGMHVFERRVADAFNAIVSGSSWDVEFTGLEQAVAEDRQYLESGQSRLDGKYWMTKLSGWNCRRASTPGGDGEAIRVTFDDCDPILSKLTTVAAQVGCANFELLLAGYISYLCSFSEEASDIVIGLPMLARMDSNFEVCPVTTANLLPLRIEGPAGMRPRRLILAVQQAMADLKRHVRYRGEDAFRDLGMDVSITEAVRFIVNYMPFTGRSFGFGNAIAQTNNISLGYTRDLSLCIHRGLSSGALSIDIDGNAALYSRESLRAKGEDIFDSFTEFMDTVRKG